MWTSWTDRLTVVLSLKCLWHSGVYHYKFVLNDAEWILDPANTQRISDGWGGENSILKVSCINSYRLLL